MGTFLDCSFFTPAQAGRASEDIALQIEAAIVSGKIPSGESLPSERELQTVFQTGRGVVREALKVLRQKGMIEVRKGARGGAFVKQIDVANVSESLALFLRQHQVDPKYIVDFRESIDRTIVSLAIISATQKEKAALLLQATNMLQAANSESPDLHKLGELDRELNIRFAAMSRNPVFEWIMGAMQLGFSSHDYALYEDEQFRKKTAQNWVDTAQSLADGNILQCTSFIGNHYLLLRECVAANAKQTQAIANMAELLTPTDKPAPE